MGVLGIDHVNIDTCDLDGTLTFYRDVLGLEARVKPSGNPGAWLYLGDRAIVHVNIVDDDRSDAPTGSFNHVAFEAVGHDELCETLVEHGFAFRSEERADLGITQIFVRDPNGVQVELNISA